MNIGKKKLEYKKKNIDTMGNLEDELDLEDYTDV